MNRLTSSSGRVYNKTDLEDFKFFVTGFGDTNLYNIIQPTGVNDEKALNFARTILDAFEASGLPFSMFMERLPKIINFDLVLRFELRLEETKGLEYAAMNTTTDDSKVRRAMEVEKTKEQAYMDQLQKKCDHYAALHKELYGILETVLATELLEYHDRNLLSGDIKTRSEDRQSRLRYVLSKLINIPSL